MTIGTFEGINSRGIYSDLMREFVKNNHSVYVACANQNKNVGTYIDKDNGADILRISTTQLTKNNIIKKGLSIIFAEFKFKNAIKKYYKNIKFDAVIYTTPPITFYSAVKYVKKHCKAKTYLLLKDIFPQNAVDIGLMSKKGLKSIIYKLFRYKEKKLYKISDNIGCMSKANVDYILKHNNVETQKVHVSPNSIEVCDIVFDDNIRAKIREKYSIPQDVTVFVYGGNLGKPQDIPFIIECLKANEDKNDRFFVICGKGTEYSKLEKYIESENPKNVLLINGLEKQEYEYLIKALDVGLIFLDNRFTIPNFPSRLLSYMQNSMPVIACTDSNTDIGKVITEGGFGWWCESNDSQNFNRTLETALSSDLKSLGQNSLEYLKKNYTVANSYKIISERIK